MVYTGKEVIQYINEEDVKFIRLAFCDIYGNQKNISIMPGEIERAFEQGISIDPSAINGFAKTSKLDLFLKPDPTTLVILPWRPDHGRVVRMFCDIYKSDNTPFESDGRRLLKRAIKYSFNKGYSFTFGSETEFYLFKTDDDGNPTKIPFDDAHYMDIAPIDKGENVRREICLTLEQMGITPERSHHEEGPGQNEIDFRFSDPLTAADNAITFKSVVKTIAQRNGLYADFSPKPLDGLPGNSFHINISMHDIKSGICNIKPMINGIIRYISDMTVFFNPTEESYKRLGFYKAPGYINWSYENREQLIRVPAAGGEYRRIELRSPDPMSNPYLAYTLLIHSCIDGLEYIDLDSDEFTNTFSDDPGVGQKLPETFAVAKEAAKASKFIKRVLPKGIINNYCN